MGAMVILMFAPIFPPVIGGPATQCASLCRALLAKGHRPVVLTPHTAFSRETVNGFVVYRYPWRYTGTALDRGIRWIVFPFYFTYVVLRERPQILHAHSVNASSFVAGVLAKIFGMPSIIKFAGDWVWETLSTPKIRGKDFEDVYTSSLSGKILRAVERFGVSLYDKVWAPSDFRRANVRALMGSDDMVVQIPNALLLPEGGMRVWDASEPALVVSANRFIPHKRVSMIVRAFKKSAPDTAKLVLIGGGEEREHTIVREEIERLGLTDRVTCTGILSSKEIYTQFAGATLYVSASLEEGFPNVFIEAMHFGLPIVTTDAGGSREMVVDGETGFVVPVMDEEALAKRMEEILHNPDLRNQFAKHAQERAKRYDLSVVVDDFISLYTSLLA